MVPYLMNLNKNKQIIVLKVYLVSRTHSSSDGLDDDVSRKSVAVAYIWTNRELYSATADSCQDKSHPVHDDASSVC